MQQEANLYVHLSGGHSFPFMEYKQKEAWTNIKSCLLVQTDLVSTIPSQTRSQATEEKGEERTAHY